MVKASPPETIIGSVVDVTYLTPALNGYDAKLDGYEGAGGKLTFNNGINNTLNNVSVGPNATGVLTLGYGQTGPSSLTLTHGVGVANSSVLSIDTTDGNTVTLNGNSEVVNNSVLNAVGGRYLADRFILNGNLTVGNLDHVPNETPSLANFSRATLTGQGTVHIEAGGIVDMKTVLAGLHVNLDNGARLFLNGFPPGAPQNSAGMIHEAAGAFVNLTGMAAAAKEVFHTSTGILDLLSTSGAQVASLQFAPGSREYTANGGNGLMEITTSSHAPMGTLNLPTIFTH